MQKHLRIMIAAILTVLFLFGATLLQAEEEEIDFKKPEPFVDHEFEELQRTYIKNRKIQLAALKKLPLNQYPEEFILELMNQIKHEVKKEVRKDLYKYLLKLSRKYKGNRKWRSRVKKVVKRSKRYNPDRYIKRNKKRSLIKMNPPTRKKDKKIRFKPVRKPQARRKKIVKKKKAYQRNQVSKFSLNSTNTPFIGINSLTKLAMHVQVKSSRAIRYVDAAIYIKNINTGMIYLLRRFPFTVIKGSKNFNFLWQYPSVPFGKYKPYVIARFYNRRKKMVSQDFQFWGNSSSPKIYILFKN